jgi:hypothetical protein
LRDFQQVEHGLGGDALDAIIAGLTLQGLRCNNRQTMALAAEPSPVGVPSFTAKAP